MPTVPENKQIWDGSYDWPEGGDEWSGPWGSVPMQWYGTILPRIRRFVPTKTILEIAPGYGRWTHFLAGMCDRLILVDLSEACIKACRERFGCFSHIEYHVNDGTSLDMIEDNAIDFAFSFDSLVHADDTVVKEYVVQLARKLNAKGAAFIHHSNLGEFANYLRIQRIPIVRGILGRLGLIDRNPQGRAETMTATKMLDYAQQNGLRCIAQEIVG